MTYPKKLIEVALPLEAINKEAARDKSIRHGHPSTLHLWWARRPLAACRAVLFSSLVDDPSEYIEGEEKQKAERLRLFNLIERLVKWENSNNEEVLDEAKLEIARSVARNQGQVVPVGKRAVEEFLATKAPPVLDPFAGGGAIPLEAQRLGLRVYASDLNPVAVLINKALIEIPHKFANLPPVHPPNEKQSGQPNMFKGREWAGPQGLAEDVRYYGDWMREQAEKRIGHLYPKVKLTTEMLAERSDLSNLNVGEELTVSAWLWARTVKCPNPACGAQMPLVSNFELSSKKNKRAWLEPYVISGQPPQIMFRVKSGHGKPPAPPKVGRGAKFVCLACNQLAPEADIRAEFIAKRSSSQLMAMVVEGKKGKEYLSSTKEHVKIALGAKPEWKPEVEMNQATPNLVSGRGYGVTHWHELFTSRQLVALTALSNLIGEARTLALQHARQAGLKDDGLGLEVGGVGAQAYADAVAVYLAFSLSKGADYWNKSTTWMPRGTVGHAFSKQALPMTWDFPEANIFANFHCSWEFTYGWVSRVLDFLPKSTAQSIVTQSDAVDLNQSEETVLVSTDPPYYDNIAYAELADFFYIWLRSSLSDVFPNLLATILTPKSEELVATSYRFGGSREKAKQFFEQGLQKVFNRIAVAHHKSFPASVFYAHKQVEATENDAKLGAASTGWETMLDSLIEAGDFRITGTWPITSERLARMVGQNANALASSIVLLCRPEAKQRTPISRRDFISDLKNELPKSLAELKSGSIAPVDLAQASIGPGMAIYSRHKPVLEADGSKMKVRTALGLINQVLDEHFAEQEENFDADTRWALTWFELYAHNPGNFGNAETLSRAKNTSTASLERSGILQARAGKVRLVPRQELASDWILQSDKQLSVWGACHYLIRALEIDGESTAATLLAKLGVLAEPAKDLAYRLYTICERKGWAQEALGYNMLVAAWPRLKELAAKQTPTLF